MNGETAKAINELSRRLFETEQKLDNYFKQLHDANAEKISIIAAAADDQMAMRGIDLYPYWKEGQVVAAEERYQHNSILYRCIQAHTTQADWAPDATPALWAVVSLEEWPEWVQPTGAHDAYAKGAKVTHNGTKYISLVDANTWEPGAAGSENLWQAAE